MTPAIIADGMGGLMEGAICAAFFVVYFWSTLSNALTMVSLCQLHCASIDEASKPGQNVGVAGAAAPRRPPLFATDDNFLAACRSESTRLFDSTGITMQCSSCGAENPTSAKFCSACGVSTSIPPKPITCPVCRHENPRAAKFCIECGARLTAAAPAANPASPCVAAPVAPIAGTNETTAVEATARVAPPAPAVGVGTAAANTASSGMATARTAQPAHIDSPTANPTVIARPAASATESATGSTATPSATAAAHQRGAAQPNPSAPTATGAVPRLNTAAAMPSDFEPVTRHALEWTIALLVLALALGLVHWLWSMQNETHQAEMAMSAAFPKGGEAVPGSAKTLPRQSMSTTSYGPTAPTPPGSHGEQVAAAAPPAISQPAMDIATVAHPTVETPQVADAKPKKPKKPSNAAPKKAEEAITQRRLAEVELTAADRALEPPRTVPNSTRAKVAECRQLSLFSRERCMWSICDGRWGKDGCPSYER